MVKNYTVTGIASCVVVSWLVGCAPVAPVVSPSQLPTEPAALEKKLFGAVSNFYCDNLTWPDSVDEVREFEAGRGREVSFLDGFGEATLSSSRAILLTVSYTSAAGSPRKVSFIAPPRCDDSADTTIDKNEVSIAGGGVRFRLPSGFSLMKGAAIQDRWKAPPYPDAAWAAPDQTLVAIRFGDLELDDAEVSDALQDMVEAYEAAVPSLVWRSKESMVLGQKYVLRHEFESRSSAGLILNIVYSASFGGRLFAITITGPLDSQQSVTQTAQSIQSSLVVR